VANPTDDHWHALERVMCYLKGTMRYGIYYTGYPRVLEGYSDSNWISNADEIKSTSGYIHSWWWRCFMEVLQVDHLNEVNYGSRIYNIRYHDYQSRMAL
jgi:hypothetical protein